MMRALVGACLSARAAVGPICLGGRAIGGALSTAAAPVPARHRPFGRLDVEACRRVLTGNHIAPANNPGIRLESRFLPEDAVGPLVTELRAVEAQYGFATAGHGLALLSRGEGGQDTGAVETRRVTGRPEGQDKPAPWGYGDAFVPDAVPAALADVVQRIRSCGSFSLGAPRACAHPSQAAGPTSPPRYVL